MFLKQHLDFPQASYFYSMAKRAHHEGVSLSPTLEIAHPRCSLALADWVSVLPSVSLFQDVSISPPPPVGPSLTSPRSATPLTAPPAEWIAIMMPTAAALGLGPGHASSSWGHILRQGSELAHVGAWHQWVFPAFTIVAAIVTCHVLADQLRSRSLAPN